MAETGSTSTASPGDHFREALVRPDLDNYAPASNLSFNEQIKTMMSEGRRVYHFAFGQSPFPVIETAVAALKDHAEEHAYLPVPGVKELREGICNFHKHFDDLDFNPDDVIVGPGSKELIFLLFQIFNGEIIVLSPCWTTYKPQAKLAHHEAIVIETSMATQWKLTPDLLDKALGGRKHPGNYLLVLNNPDNPTGTSYTENELTALSEKFREHKIIVLSDEIYGRLSYRANHCSLKKVYPEGTILCSGLSKWASAGGWRVGYHVYPPQLSALKNAVKSAGSHTYSCAPAPMQYAATEMFNDLKACEEYIQHTTRILAACADFCCRELTSVGVKVVQSTAGYYIFPDFEVIKSKLKARGIVTCQQMCDVIFKECSVAVMAGGPAFLRPLDELTTRLCYVAFNGKIALQKSRDIGLASPVGKDFVQLYCCGVYDGIMALKDWVKQQQDGIQCLPQESL